MRNGRLRNVGIGQHRRDTQGVELGRESVRQCGSQNSIQVRRIANQFRRQRNQHRKRLRVQRNRNGGNVGLDNIDRAFGVLIHGRIAGQPRQVCRAVDNDGPRAGLHRHRLCANSINHDGTQAGRNQSRTACGFAFFRAEQRRAAELANTEVFAARIAPACRQIFAWQPDREGRAHPAF